MLRKRSRHGGITIALVAVGVVLGATTSLAQVGNCFEYPSEVCADPCGQDVTLSYWCCNTSASGGCCQYRCYNVHCTGDPGECDRVFTRRLLVAGPLNATCQGSGQCTETLL